MASNKLFSIIHKTLDKVEKKFKDLGLIVSIKVSYADLDKCKYYLKQNNIQIANVDYDENIKLTVEMTQEQLEQIKKKEKSLNFIILKIEVIREKYIISY